MIIIYFQYYDGSGQFYNTEELPSKFKEMTDAVKFIECMRSHFNVIKVEIEFTE